MVYNTAVSDVFLVPIASQNVVDVRLIVFSLLANSLMIFLTCSRKESVTLNSEVTSEISLFFEPVLLPSFSFIYRYRFGSNWGEFVLVLWASRGREFLFPRVE